MSLLRKKCAYCGNRIPKGEEVFRDVKVPAFVGTRRKAFMSGDHADAYEKEVSSSQCKSGGGCC